jgi:hypothetical protein
MTSKKIIMACSCLIFASYSIAQDVNLDSLLDAEINKKSKNQTQLTEATFKTSRLINSHTVETTQKGVLDLKISHRFSAINNGIYDLFGLDNAISMRFGADYGITNRLTIGGGRSSYEKEYDGFLKYRLLWQSTGKKNIPVSVTLLSSIMYKTLKKESFDTVTKQAYTIPLTASEKMSYALQALIARKFSSSFSFQLMPTLVNTVDTSYKHYNLFSLGAGARLKLTKRSAIIAEYYYQLPGHALQEKGSYFKTYNSFSLGYEIETGGHVFQLSMGNSVGISERTFITQTKEPWSFNSLHLGFNISRVFTVKKPKSLPQGIQQNQKWSPVTDSTINKNSGNATQYAQATFKTTRLINGHTVETTQKGVLDFRVTHRFGKISEGIYKMFGMDEASMRIGMDYGINNRLTIGAGRSAGGLINSFEKDYDGFIKYRVLWQSTGEKNMPISLTFLSSAIINTLRSNIKDSAGNKIDIKFEDRLRYAQQILIARKFSNAFSLQVAPTWIHYNIVPDSSTSNDLFSVGLGTRIKLTPRSSLNAEFYYQFNKLTNTSQNSFSVGYEIETGGHVFQLHLTNSTSMSESTFITTTTDKWNKGQIHIGFNISRVFTVKKAKDNSNYK